jgi:hypothetical protein
MLAWGTSPADTLPFAGLIFIIFTGVFSLAKISLPSRWPVEGSRGPGSVSPGAGSSRFGTGRGWGAVQTLSSLLMGDPDPRVRQAVARALGTVRSEEARWALQAAALDSDKYVRQARGGVGPGQVGEASRRDSVATEAGKIGYQIF